MSLDRFIIEYKEVKFKIKRNDGRR